METKIHSLSLQKPLTVKESENKKESSVDCSPNCSFCSIPKNDTKNTKTAEKRKISIVRQHKKEEFLPLSYFRLFRSRSYYERKVIYENACYVVLKITYNGNHYALKYPNLQPENYNDQIKNPLQLMERLNSQLDNEINALHRLENVHENIIHLLQYYEVKEQVPYKILVMPYFSKDFFDFFEETYSFTLSFCLDFAKQLTSGIDFIHKNGIIHGDIKPDNILISYKDRQIIFKIIDFGLCILHPYTSKVLCKISYLIGTAQYRPPEFDTLDENNKFHTNHSFDNYSLGIIIQEMLTRKPLEIGISMSQFTKIKRTLNQSIKLATVRNPLQRISAQTWNKMLHEVLQ